MIKLKTLLQESEYLWRSQPDMPEEVVDVIHRIIAVVMRDDGDPFPQNWIDVSEEKKFWIINNKQKYNKPLIFDPSLNRWFSVVPTGIKIIPITNTDVSKIIDNWTNYNEK